MIIHEVRATLLEDCANLVAQRSGHAEKVDRVEQERGVVVHLMDQRVHELFEACGRRPLISVRREEVANAETVAAVKAQIQMPIQPQKKYTHSDTDTETVAIRA